MSTNSVNVKNAIVNAVTSTGGTGGSLVIQTSGAATLATFVWTGINMFGTGSTGVITMVAPTTTPVSATGTGTAALATIQTSGAAAVISGLTVGTSGTDIIIDSTSIISGQSVNLTYGSCTITAP